MPVNNPSWRSARAVFMGAGAGRRSHHARSDSPRRDSTFSAIGRYTPVVVKQRRPGDVPPGIVQAIIGPNGSGKTTLLNALSGASHADTGSIHIGGQEIFRLKPHRIARLGLARTFQNIRIFDNLSVIENVKVAAACNSPTSCIAPTPPGTPVSPGCSPGSQRC